MAQSDWPRWIFSSASQHFQAVADANSVLMFIENVERQTTKETKHIEFRLDGPSVIELSHNYYKLDIGVNILYSVDMDNENFHEPQRLIGLITEAMTDICIHKYGDGETFLGTMILKSTRTSNFGQVKEDSQIIQGTVDGFYELYLTGE